jgi:hypothetical protein
MSVVKRLFLVRHCESTGQEASAPLTAIGQSQAVLLADHLETAGGRYSCQVPTLVRSNLLPHLPSGLASRSRLIRVSPNVYSLPHL